MRKVEPSVEQERQIIKLYTEEKFGLKRIAIQIFGKETPGIIKRVLNKFNIPIGNIGRKFKGGKKEAGKRYYKKHKVKIKEYQKDYAKNNRDDLREYHTGWREDNKEYVRLQRNERVARLRKTDPFFRLNQNFKTAMYTALKEQKVTKNNHTFDLVGYTLDSLIKYLEAKFTVGMTWENYGKWHVDHIIPISFFSFLTTEDPEFKKCWGLSNLQPLWEKDNLSKGNKIL